MGVLDDILGAVEGFQPTGVGEPQDRALRLEQTPIDAIMQAVGPQTPTGPRLATPEKTQPALSTIKDFFLSPTELLAAGELSLDVFRKQNELVGKVFEEGVTGRNLSQKAREAGVGVEGVGPAIRFDINLALEAVDNPEEELELVRRAFKRSTGKDVQVRVGPKTGRLEFLRDGQWELVNAPGIIDDFLSDIAAAGPEIGAFGTGAVTGVGGAFAGIPGGPAGIIAGAAIGEGLGEGLAIFGELLLAQKRGLNDDTIGELFQKAAVRAGIATAVGGVGGTAIRVFTKMVSKTYGIDETLLKVVGDPDKFAANLQRSGQVSGQVEAATGVPLPLTSGQVTGAGERLAGRQVGPEAQGLLTAEDALRKQGPDLGGSIEETLAAQRRAEDILTSQTFRDPGPVTLEAASRDASGIVKERVRSSLERETQGIMATRRAIRSETDDLVAREVTPKVGVTNFREIVKADEDAIFAPFGQKFDDISQRTNRIDLTQLRVDAEDIISKEDQKIFGSLSVANEEVLQEARKAGLKLTERAIPGPDGKPVKVLEFENVPATLGEVQRALRDVRRTIRDLSDQATPKNSQKRRVLQLLKEKLEGVRNNQLDFDTLNEVVSLENSFTKQTEIFRSKVVAELTKQNSSGVFELTGNKALKTVLSSTENAEFLVEALSKMDNGGAALKNIQNGILGQISRSFLEEGTREVNVRGFSTFLKNNKDQLKVIFKDDPVMLRSLENTATFSRQVIRKTETKKRLKQTFSRVFNHFDGDPASLIKRLTAGDGQPDELLKLEQLIRGRAPGEISTFLNGVADAARQKISRLRPGELNPTVSPESIQEFVNSPIGRATAKILGPQYTKNLNLLQQVLQLSRREVDPTAAQALSRKIGPGVPGLQGLLRFSRVVFPPLSPKGRALTGFLGIANERSQRQISKLLANPQRLNQVMQLVRVDPTSEAARVVFARLGFEHIPQVIEALEREDR